MKKGSKGGKRTGAGRKTLRGEVMTKTVAFRVYPELLGKLEAIKEQMTLSQFFNKMIDEYKL